MKKMIRLRKRWGAGLIGLVACLWATVPAEAATWYVATNGNGSAGTAWDTAFTNVQDALDAAISNDTIYVAGQTFWLTDPINWTNAGFTVRGGYEAAETDPAKLPGTNNPALWPTVLARATGTMRILFLDSADNSTLEYVTVTGGNAYDGGGLRIENSLGVHLSGCVITNNGGIAPSMALGGGAGIWETGSNVTLSNCVLRANRARGYTGGDHPNNRCFGGAIASYGTLALRDCVLIDNQATTAYRGPAYGAGIYFAGTRLALTNVLLAANNAAGSTTAGDGLYAASGTVTLDNCTVVDHSGAGVLRAGGTVTLNNSILRDNWADLSGIVTTNHTLVGADPLFEYGYYLADGSPARNTGSDTAANLGLQGYAKNVAGETYGGAEIVNLGWHNTGGFDTGYADLFVATDGDDEGNTGLTAGSPFKTLTKALGTARAGTRIHLAAGVYSASATGETFPLAAYDLPGLQILGAGAAETILDAASAADTRVLDLTCVPRGAVADLTLTGGNNYEGGGLRFDNCQNARVSGCLVSNNTFTLAIRATRQGAGIYAGSSAVSLTNCTIRNNIAINNLDFPETTAFGAGVASDGYLAMRDCTVYDNRAATIARAKAYGAGIYFNGVRFDGVNLLLAANNADGPTTAGDGLYVAAGTVELDNCTIADHSGDGVFRAAGTVTLNNSILWDNWTDLSGTVTTNHTLVGVDPLFEYGYYLGESTPAANAGSDTAAALGLADYAKNTAGETYGGAELVNLGWHYSSGFDTGYADLFVATDGDDEGNTGLTAGSPFKTLTKALGTARAGTRIHLAAGVYSASATGETFPLAAYDLPGLQILGAGADTTVLDAGSVTGTRVLDLDCIHRGVIEDVTLTGGKQYGGGGLRAMNSRLLLTDCAVTNNGRSSSGYVDCGGAGIWETSSDLTLTRCRVAGNAGANATSHPNGLANGGGIASFGNLTLRECVIANNTISGLRGNGRGGGVYFTGNRLEVKNSLIAGNAATKTGDGLQGGAGVYVAAGAADLVNATLAGNDGQGIRRVAGTAALLNTILWGNENDIEGTVTIAWSNIEDGDNLGADGCISADPLFVDAANGNFRLLEDSPSAGTGLLQEWMADAVDLDGYPRISMGRVDMGCYQVRAPAGTLFLVR